MPDGVVIVSGDYYATVENHQVGALVEGKFEVSAVSSGQSEYVKATEAFSNKFITGVTYYTESATDTYTEVTNPVASGLTSYYVKVVGTNNDVKYTEYENSDIASGVIVYVPVTTA